MKKIMNMKIIGMLAGLLLFAPGLTSAGSTSDSNEPVDMESSSVDGVYTQIVRNLNEVSDSPLNIFVDIDGNGFPDHYEQELADMFCPSLILHSQDHGVSPEPVEIIRSIIWRRCEGRTNGGYYGDDFSELGWQRYDWLDSWEYYHQGVRFGEARYGSNPCNPNTDSDYFWMLPHFDYAYPNAGEFDYISGGYYDQPDGWYDAYENGVCGNDLYKGSYYPNTVYAHLFTHNEEYVIQYWFFYPFNNFVNDHEGDWEHINVVLTSNDPHTAEIDRVIYYFHKYFSIMRTSQVENPDEFDFYVIGGTHPVVFVGGFAEAEVDIGPIHASGAGPGSHGSYPIHSGGSYWDTVSPGDWFGFIPDIDEYVDGQGLCIPWTHIVDYDDNDQYGVVLIKEPSYYDFSNPANWDTCWLAANIIWGNPWVESMGTNLEFTPGWDATNMGNRPPDGPAYNDGWVVVDEEVEPANGMEGLAEYLKPLPNGWSHVSDAGWSWAPLEDSEPPTIIDDSASEGYAGYIYTISIRASDASGIFSVVADYWSHGSHSGVREPFHNNDDGTWILEIPLDYCTDDLYYKITAIDWWGNENIFERVVPVYVYDPVILHVPSVEYPTIQAAINAAYSGDTILIASGEYEEEFIDVNVAEITIMGSGPHLTTVKGNFILNADDIILSNMKIAPEEVDYYYGAIHVDLNGEGTITINNTIIDGGNADDPLLMKIVFPLFNGMATRNMKIVNNVFANSYVGICFSKSPPDPPYATYLIEVKNNIFYNNCNTETYMTGMSSLLQNSEDQSNNINIGNIRLDAILGDTGTWFDYNCYWDNDFSMVWDYDMWNGTNNIKMDPAFINTQIYRLRFGSPCIDAGDPADDYSREPEPNGDRINIGPYGNTQWATRSPEQNVYALPFNSCPIER